MSFDANPEFDRICSQSRTEQDSAKREALYRQADSLAFAEAPMIYLWFYNELYAVQPWVKGFVAPTIFNGQQFTDATITAH